MTTPRLSVWPPLPPAAWLRSRREQLPFPLANDGTALYSRARHAIARGVRALGLVPGDEVLVPAYHHGSEVEALVRSQLVPRFYDGTALAPDEEELRRALSPRTRALYLVHTLGVPQDVARWRGWADDHGLLLVEDAAQAWLADDPDGRPVGAAADLAVFCLYKTIGLPDGAALVLRGSAAPSPPASGVGAAAAAKRHAA
ncbi:MAG: DegT/DnrJ/EryC1/StrS family aminotransferase, partial [Actinomycetota bacterium]|nr:DegT/DnrJ/EryC1/StrS family aminotransferase [Actinomycetota bacterium]